MPNQYVYNSYQQLYSPSIPNGSLNVVGTSPTFTNMNYNAPNSAESSASSTTSSMGSSVTSNSSNYSFHTPRLRYYLSKSFDIEDDMEFCPDIPEIAGNSPQPKDLIPTPHLCFLLSFSLKATMNPCLPWIVVRSLLESTHQESRSRWKSSTPKRRCV